MKTASRILGSAAFRAGYEVQDSPTYGAERRGAPMMAYTRVATEPILERGAIERPDLVVIADETLVDEPASSPLAGVRENTTVLVNTRGNEGERSVREPPAIDLVRFDFTEMVLRATEGLSGLSTALGAAASCLIGLDEQDCVAAIDDELKEAVEDGEALEKNRALAHEVYGLGTSWTRVSSPVEAELDTPRAKLVELALDAPRRAAPSIYAAANSPARHTGSWRQFRPVLEADKCNRCWLCFVWCPEAAITLDADEFPRVDYDVCKGCLLCAHECPTKAFRVEREVRV